MLRCRLHTHPCFLFVHSYYVAKLFPEDKLSWPITLYAKPNIRLTAIASKRAGGNLSHRDNSAKADSPALKGYRGRISWLFVWSLIKPLNWTRRFIFYLPSAPCGNTWPTPALRILPLSVWMCCKEQLCVQDTMGCRMVNILFPLLFIHAFFITMLHPGFFFSSHLVLKFGCRLPRLHIWYLSRCVHSSVGICTSGVMTDTEMICFIPKKWHWIHHKVASKSIITSLLTLWENGDGKCPCYKFPLPADPLRHPAILIKCRIPVLDSRGRRLHCLRFRHHPAGKS